MELKPEDLIRNNLRDLASQTLGMLSSLNTSRSGISTMNFILLFQKGK
jgi:hypothetical protein